MEVSCKVVKYLQYLPLGFDEASTVLGPGVSYPAALSFSGQILI